MSGASALNKEIVRHAVIEQYKLWLDFDGILLKQANGKELTPDMVRTIARPYGVNRGIKKDENGQQINAKGVADAVNGFAIADWSKKTLTARGEDIFAVATMLNGKYTHGVQVSAISKLAWFLQPQGWTMYDEYAARSLGVRGSRGEHRVQAFYRVLDERGFMGVSAAIQSTLRATPLKSQYGGRVIDKYLWLRWTGDNQWETTKTMHKHFLTLLPNKFGQEVTKIASDIANKHADGMLGLIKV